MLEKKRQEIRKKMRRMSVEKQFQEMREQIYKKHALQPKPQRQEWTRIHVEVNNCLSELHHLLKAKKYNSTGNYLEYLVNQLNQKSSMSAAILSNCDQFCLVFRLAIKNAIQKQKDEEIQFLRCGSIEQAFVAQLLGIMGKMTYYEFEKDKLLNFIDCLWDIFREDIIYLSIQENNHMLERTLRMIYKMLEPQDQFIFNSLKDIGLGSRLASIAKSKGSTMVTPVEITLVKIIETYLYQESILYGSSQVCQINGIHIIGIENNEKQILMAYCLAVLQSRSAELNLHCINSLIIILKKYEYLGSTICIEQIKDTLFELIRSQNRKVKAKAIELMDVIVYSQDKEALNELLTGMKLPSILQDILLQEFKYKDDQSSAIIQSASVVICNLTLVTNKRLRKQLMVHPIWDLAYQNIYAGSPLLPLVTVFEYYFDMVGRGVDFRIIESYLAAVSQLDLQLIDEKISQVINKTIRRLYLDCKDFWPQSMQQRLVALLKDYHMGHIVDQLMSQQQDPL